MRIDKYTQKMQEALQAAQDLASQANHPEITNEHFLSALLDQGEGITRPLLEKIGANVDQLRDRLRSELERRPKIHGVAADVRLANELRNVLDSAEKEMSKLKDELPALSIIYWHWPARMFRLQNYLRNSASRATKSCRGFSRCAAPSA